MNPKARRKSLTVSLLMLPLLLATRIAIASPSAAGHWAGTSKVRCGTRLSAQERCNAIQNITFDLTQDEAEVAGTYSCAYGTQNCLAMNRKGKITDGTFDGHSLMLSVDMGNGSTCRFKGGLKQKTGQGSYSCKGQSAAEQGTWKLHRVSAEAPAAPPKIPSLLRPNDPGSP